MWHYGDSAASWLWMAGAMTLMSIVTVVVVISIMRAARRDGSSGDSARRALNERYARGDIGHDDYEQRRRRLNAL